MSSPNATFWARSGIEPSKLVEVTTKRRILFCQNFMGPITSQATNEDIQAGILRFKNTWINKPVCAILIK